MITEENKLKFITGEHILLVLNIDVLLIGNLETFLHLVTNSSNIDLRL